MPASGHSAQFIGISCAVGILSPILVLALAGFPAQGHHSVIGMYNPDMQVTLTGVVAEFHFVRPHPYLVLDADPDENGTWRWRLEFDNHRELAQIGVTEDTFSPGDEVIVAGDYARNGTERMYVRELRRPEDGLLYECPGFRPSLKVVRQSFESGGSIRFWTRFFAGPGATHKNGSRIYI